MTTQDPSPAPDTWGDEEPKAAAADEEFIIDIDGFEGPLDLLLELARQHKIDLAQISILQLANQYLAFHRSAAHAPA